MSAEKPTLDDLVKEAKQEFAPRDVDWSKIEAELMPRVEREARAQSEIAAYRGKRSRAWMAAGAVLAAAAAIPLLFARAPSAPLEPTASEAPERAASALSWKEPRATATRTRGDQSSETAVGDALARGDAIEVRGGRAVFAREAPGQVTWGLEEGTRAVVTASRGALILTLEKGAVEAQVAPVEGGEAFAVDVGGARVAVHGTHLRVAQEGTRAIVDLREGVVSIGLPPKSGSTYGDLVTAPAHVEFDPADPHGSLKVSHDVGRVRAAAVLDAPIAPLAIDSHPQALKMPATDRTPRAAMIAPAATPPVTAAPKVTPPAAPVSVAAPSPPPPAPPHVSANPEGAITDAIRACAKQHQATLPAGVSLTVMSRLELKIADGGMVSGAVFDPPLGPELRDCAARAVYATRFSSAGAVSIPIDFTVP